MDLKISLDGLEELNKIRKTCLKMWIELSKIQNSCLGDGNFCFLFFMGWSNDPWKKDALFRWCSFKGKKFGWQKVDLVYFFTRASKCRTCFSTLHSSSARNAQRLYLNRMYPISIIAHMLHQMAIIPWGEYRSDRARY